MIYKERLYKILLGPYVSEKTSVVLQRCNAVVFKVARYATKADIKSAIIMLFGVKVNSVNTVITNKIKNSAKNIRYHNSWKKAYIVLEKGQNIDFVHKSE